MRSPGIEVAAYPLPAYGDTDLNIRLLARGQISARQLPSISQSVTRKILTRCAEYKKDFVLQCLLSDVFLAKRISAVVNTADKRDIAGDVAASEMQIFSGFWKHASEKLIDMCWQNASPEFEGISNLFLTVAPAEWQLPNHDGPCGRSEFARQLDHVHAARVPNDQKEYVLAKECRGAELVENSGIREVYDYAMRFEFQPEARCICRRMGQIPVPQ